MLESILMIKDPSARITYRRNWGDYHLIRITSPEIAQKALPGQFIMARVSDRSVPLLRRPFSIHSREGDSLEIFFQSSGIGTTLLAGKKEGESLNILGPLGNGFDIKNGSGKKRAAAVGGGRGIAPIYFLAQELLALGSDVTVFYGGKTALDLPLKERFEAKNIRLMYSTDDGSLGFRGFVTELVESKIDQLNPEIVFACGPDLMMEEIAGITKKNGIPAQLSLESIMGCGFGACWGCVKKIRMSGTEEWTKICQEGPVFPADRIIWE